MAVGGLLSAVLVPVCWLFVSAAEDAVAGSRAAVTNSSLGGGNLTLSGGGKSPGAGAGAGLFNGLDGSMIQRALYVLIGITGFGVLYFLIRAVRLKRPAHRRKYGLLSHQDDGVELDAAESDEDEDDTLYEARSLRR